MSTQVEQHGCVVCGRMHTLKVTYGPAGKVQNCVVTSLDGRCLPGSDKPMVVCNTHSSAEIEAAVAKHAHRVKEEEEENER